MYDTFYENANFQQANKDNNSKMKQEKAFHLSTSVIVEYVLDNSFCGKKFFHNHFFRCLVPSSTYTARMFECKMEFRTEFSLLQLFSFQKYLLKTWVSSRIRKVFEIIELKFRFRSAALFSVYPLDTLKFCMHNLQNWRFEMAKVMTSNRSPKIPTILGAAGKEAVNGFIVRISSNILSKSSIQIFFRGSFRVRRFRPMKFSVAMEFNLKHTGG